MGCLTLAFSRTGTPPSELLKPVLDGASQAIDAAVYGLTHPVLVEALVEAKRRGVKVRVITDALESRGPSQAAVVRRLLAAGIPVRVNKHTGLMHLKVAVVDGRVGALGSYNWTGNADHENDEVLALTTCPEAVRALAAEFERLWQSEDFDEAAAGLSHT